MVPVFVAVLLSAEPWLHTPMPVDLPDTAPVNAPARGSVPGPWAFAQLGASLGNGIFTSPHATEVHLLMSAVAGFGAEVDGVKLVPALSFSSSVELTDPVMLAFPAFISPARPAASSRFDWSPVALTIASPDLLYERRFTGLRLTPIFGLTMPTRPLDEAPITTVSFALQLERRFGPLELAWRATVEKPISLVTAPYARFVSRAFAELWFLPSLSMAAGVTTLTAWVPAGITGFPIQDDSVAGTAQLNWAVTELFGVTFDVATFQALRAPGPRFPLWSTGLNQSQFVLLLWLRTDALLKRNWLDF